ncbi:hypothetical protein WG66_016237 [Moniliophthora roreri]|nr:hypothetical protein WG66_016237 [Moniliophthora roreri]
MSSPRLDEMKKHKKARAQIVLYLPFLDNLPYKGTLPGNLGSSLSAKGYNAFTSRPPSSPTFAPKPYALPVYRPGPKPAQRNISNQPWMRARFVDVRPVTDVVNRYRHLFGSQELYFSCMDVEQQQRRVVVEWVGQRVTGLGQEFVGGGDMSSTKSCT